MTPPSTDIYTLSLHDALPISPLSQARRAAQAGPQGPGTAADGEPGPHDPAADRGPGRRLGGLDLQGARPFGAPGGDHRSEEHTFELQSRQYLVCRLLLEKKKR